jgi:hypothetical protein
MNGDRAAPKLSASELPSEPNEIELDAATLGDYVGNYQLNSGAAVDFTLKGDHLETQITGQLALPISASAKDKFFLKVVDAQVEFECDAAGRSLRWFCTKPDAISEYPGWRLNDDIGSMMVVAASALKRVAACQCTPDC